MPDLKEVPEAEAQGKVKGIYDDIMSTLQISTVGFLFRRLALYPWYLQLAWRHLKPNASIVYFHRTAGDLRRESLEWMHAELKPDRTQMDTTAADFQDSLSLFLDLDSKLLLAAGALVSGLNGQLPKMHLISDADKEPVRPGSPKPSVTLTNQDEEQASAEQHALTAQIREIEWAPDISDFQVLLAWPQQFSGAWSGIKPLLSAPTFEAYARRLSREAMNAVEALPFRMEVSATAARHAGLTEDQIDGVRSILNDAWGSLPRALLAIAAMSSTFATETRAEMPEPAAAAP